MYILYIYALYVYIITFKLRYKNCLAVMLTLCFGCD